MSSVVTRFGNGDTIQISSGYLKGIGLKGDPGEVGPRGPRGRDGRTGSPGPVGMVKEHSAYFCIGKAIEVAGSMSVGVDNFVGPWITVPFTEVLHNDGVLSREGTATQYYLQAGFYMVNVSITMQSAPYVKPALGRRGIRIMSDGKQVAGDTDALASDTTSLLTASVMIHAAADNHLVTVEAQTDSDEGDHITQGTLTISRIGPGAPGRNGRDGRSGVDGSAGAAGASGITLTTPIKHEDA